MEAYASVVIERDQLRARNAELEAEVARLSQVPTPDGFGAQIESLQAEVARLLKIVELALEGLYNGFEPDNQSARYNKIKAELEASDG